MALRVFARVVRTVGLVLAAYCLLTGIIGMILLVANWHLDLSLAIGFFFLMLVPAAFLATAGLAARQMFLAILELSERQRRVLDLLDELREKP